MRRCVGIVRQTLDGRIPDLSDKAIEDSLWHYYYDTDKTVRWLLSAHDKTLETA
jgi:hypothetical protein